jgi:hypothetical protein
MMTENPVSPKSFSSRHVARSSFVVLACSVLLSNGCSVKRRPSIPWNAAILVRPTYPPRPVSPVDLSEDPVPDLRIELPTFPLRLISTKSPARPHLPALATGGGTETEKMDAPLIAPQLSPRETVAAQVQMDENLNIAEKNLAAMRGKNLNGAQTDLVSKIQGFIKDAREAARLLDWMRARSLSRKAQLLSEELVGLN